MQTKRPITNSDGDGSSESESDEISDATVATQLYILQNNAEPTV